MADLERRAADHLDEHNPLLRSDREHLSSLRQSRDLIARHIIRLHGEGSWPWRLRHQLQRFLTSKWGHYFVILLVTADICCIFANFLISLHICEHEHDEGFDHRAWEKAEDVLDWVTLAFSCLFMTELLANIFAFGFGYFHSKFHIFDACVIVAAFIIDILLHGPIEEAGTLVVVFRLWRVFKIIEELSSGAEDEIEELQTRVKELEREKDAVVHENRELKARSGQGAYSDNDSDISRDDGRRDDRKKPTIVEGPAEGSLRERGGNHGRGASSAL